MSARWTLGDIRRQQSFLYAGCPRGVSSVSLRGSHCLKGFKATSRVVSRWRPRCDPIKVDPKRHPPARVTKYRNSINDINILEGWCRMPESNQRPPHYE